MYFSYLKPSVERPTSTVTVCFMRFEVTTPTSLRRKPCLEVASTAGVLPVMLFTLGRGGGTLAIGGFLLPEQRLHARQVAPGAADRRGVVELIGVVLQARVEDFAAELLLDLGKPLGVALAQFFDF